MDCHTLAFSQLPHQPKLFLAYLEKFETVKTFYTHAPTMQAVTEASRKLDYPAERGVGRRPGDARQSGATGEWGAGSGVRAAGGTVRRTRIFLVQGADGHPD